MVKRKPEYYLLDDEEIYTAQVIAECFEAMPDEKVELLLQAIFETRELQVNQLIRYVASIEYVQLMDEYFNAGKVPYDEWEVDLNAIEEIDPDEIEVCGSSEFKRFLRTCYRKVQDL